MSDFKTELGAKIEVIISGDLQAVSVEMFLLDKVLYINIINPLNPELNPICYLLALLGAHHFLHVSRIRVKLLTFRLLVSYIYIYIYIYIWSTHS